MTEEKKEIGSEVFTADMKNANVALQISAKIGQELIQSALTEYQDKQKKKIVASVSTIMERIETLDALERKTIKRLELCRKQLAAINAGEFTIVDNMAVYSPDFGTSTIKFNNAELNVDWSTTERW